MHWVRAELVAEVKYLTWTEDNLLRQVVYQGLREDKNPAGPPFCPEPNAVFCPSLITGSGTRSDRTYASPLAYRNGARREPRPPPRRRLSSARFNWSAMLSLLGPIAPGPGGDG